MLVCSPSLNGSLCIGAVVGAGVAVCLIVCRLVDSGAVEVGFVLINGTSLWSDDWVAVCMSCVPWGSDVAMGWICWL